MPTLDTPPPASGSSIPPPLNTQADLTQVGVDWLDEQDTDPYIESPFPPATPIPKSL